MRASPSSLLPAALSAALGLAACHTAPGVAPVPSDGCAAPLIAPGGPVNGSLSVAGTTRTYQVFVPTGDAHAPRVLVFVFHGSGGSGANIRGYVGRPMETAAAGDAVFVYPDGLPDGGGTGWPNTGGRDVAFFDALLARLSAETCLDQARVFVTGFSYGGYMSNTVGCARAGVVRAIAPLSGGGPGGGCNGQPVAAWLGHGANDTTVTLDQGTGSRDHWLQANHCAGTSSATSPAPCVAYDGCGQDPVVWCAFAGTHEVQAWEPPAVWAFFRGF